MPPRGGSRHPSDNQEKRCSNPVQDNSLAEIDVAPAVVADSVTRRFGSGETAVDALGGVSLELPSGQFTAVMGPSGSGKSTLMHILAGLDQPTSGSVWIGGHEITAMNDKQLTLLRRRAIGFVFQSFVQPAADADGRGQHRAAAQDREQADRPRMGRHGDRAGRA